MAWTNLKTTFKDLVWTGLKKYNITNLADNSVTSASIEDVTSYTNRQDSFWGAGDANAVNGAINDLMNGTGNTPLATTSKFGYVKPDGSTITVTNGVISSSKYTLPTASSSTLGGVKVGSGLSISNGVLSANVQSVSNASTTAYGTVKYDGSTIKKNTSGQLYVDFSSITATDSYY